MPGRRKSAASEQRSRRKKRIPSSSSESESDSLDLESDATEVITAIQKPIKAAVEETQLFHTQEEKSPVKPKKNKGKKEKKKKKKTRQRSASTSTTDTEEAAKATRKRTKPSKNITSSYSDSPPERTKADIQLATPDDPIISNTKVVSVDVVPQPDQNLSLDTSASENTILNNTLSIPDTLPTSEYGTLTTGSGKPIEVDKKTAKRISKKLGIDDDEDSLPTKDFGVLTTGSGKAVAVDKKAMKKVSKKLGIEPEDESLPTPDYGILTTGSGKPIEVDKQVAKRISKKLGIEDDEDSPLPTKDFGVLTTGSGKAVTVDKKAMKKVSKKLGIDPEEESPPTPECGILTTGSGKPIEFDKKAAKRISKKLGIDDDEDSPPTKDFGVLTTGSGKAVAVDKKAMKKVSKKLGIDPDEESLPTPEYGVLTTGNGNPVKVNKETANKISKKLGLTDDMPTAIPGVLTTGSGKSVSVDHKVAKELGEKLGLTSTDNDNDNPPTSKMGILTTGSGREVSVDMKSAAKIRKKLGLDDDNDTDVDPPTASFGILTTGSGKKVSVDNKAAAALRKKLGLDDTPETETEVGVATLTTGSGRAVAVDEKAAEKIRKKLGLTDDDTNNEPPPPPPPPPPQTERETIAAVGRRHSRGMDASPTPLRNSKLIQKARPSGITTPNLRRPSLVGKRQLHKSAALQSFAAGRQSNSKGFKPPKTVSPKNGEPTTESVQRPKRGSDLAIQTPAGIPRKYPSKQSGGITSGMHYRNRVGSCTDEIVFPPTTENLFIKLSDTPGCMSIKELCVSFNLTLQGEFLTPPILQSLLLNLGASEKHVTLKWVQHHMRLLVIKFSHQDYTYLPPSSLPKFLSAENLLSQLVYRYNKEYAEGVRSPLLQIYNKDRDTTGRCLCLKILKYSPESSTIEVTDGWYVGAAIIDPPLKEKLACGVLCVGNTILTYSPDVVLENASDPLDQIDPLTLFKIEYNSTRKCNGIRLGFLKRGTIPQVRLSDIHPEGGTVPCIEICVQRRYPPSMVETIEGKADDKETDIKRYVIRSTAAEQRCTDAFRRQQEDSALDLRYEIEKTIQKTLKQPLSDCPSENEKYRAEYQRMSDQLFQEKQATFSNQRIVHERHELLVTDSGYQNSFLPSATFKTYSNLYNVLEPLREGRFAYIYNTTPSKSQPKSGERSLLTLTPVRRKCFSREIKNPASCDVFTGRSVVPISNLSSLRHKGMFDTVGIILQHGSIREYPGTEIQTIVLCSSGPDLGGKSSSSVLRIEAKKTSTKEAILGSAAHPSKQGCIIGFLDLQYIGSQVINNPEDGTLVVHVASFDERSSAKENLKSAPHLSQFASSIDLSVYTRLNHKGRRMASVVRQATPTLLGNNTQVVGQNPQTPQINNTPTMIQVTPMTTRSSYNSVSPPVLTPSVSPECQSTCFESTLHVFGHFTLPWCLTFSEPSSNNSFSITLSTDTAPPAPGKLRNWVHDSSFSMKCSLQDGWSESKCLTMNKHRFSELLFGGHESINAENRQRLINLMERGDGELGAARKYVLSQHGSNIARVFCCLCNSYVVDSQGGRSPPTGYVPFTRPDWNLFVGLITSNASILLKATLRQRSPSLVQKSAEPPIPHQQLQWTVQKLFPLTHNVAASQLYE